MNQIQNAVTRLTSKQHNRLVAACKNVLDQEERIAVNISVVRIPLKPLTKQEEKRLADFASNPHGEIRFLTEDLNELRKAIAAALRK